jgi:hypothetical protein
LRLEEMPKVLPTWVKFLLLLYPSIIIVSAATTACINITSSRGRIDHFETEGLVGGMLLKWTLACKLKWNIINIIVF